MSLGLFHVLDGDQADRSVVVIHHDQAFYLVATQQIAGLGLRDALPNRDQIILGHQFLGRNISAAFEAHVAVGQDTAELAGLGIDHRKAGDLAPRLDRQDLAERRLRIDGQWIDDHAAFITLHLADLIGLLLNGEVAVQHPDSAGLGHGDGQPAFGDRVHGGGHERDVQIDLSRKPGRDIHLGGHHIGRTWFEQNIVEGKPFANLHWSLRFCGAGIGRWRRWGQGRTCGSTQAIASPAAFKPRRSSRIFIRGSLSHPRLNPSA